MTVTSIELDQTLAPRDAVEGAPITAHPRDLQRTFQLVLATVWLLDAVLQIQPFMFAPGRNGFSGMIGGLAAGNPGWIARTITWNASVVDHHPVLTNTAFALIQFLIAFGIVWRRSCKAALTLSIVWAIGVWWFGEGLGGIFSGRATPLGGGPGGVLFYAVLAVVLWPSTREDAPFVAARTLGVRRAKALWTAVWGLLAVLCVVGAGRSGQSLNGLVTGVESGQPGWLVHLNRFSSAFLLHDGTAAAVILAALCCIAGLSAYLPATATQLVIIVVVAAFLTTWVAVQDFGGILTGGATDPNAAPLVVLLAFVYWPLTHERKAVPAALVRVPSCGTTVARDVARRPFVAKQA